MQSEQRFILLERPGQYGLTADDFTEDTRWWVDTARDIAVQTMKDKDPNQFIYIDGEMCLLFTDPCEYYVVCEACYFCYRSMQWSGSTRGAPEWRERAEQKRQRHQETKGWCEFCDPVFGNGGWSLFISLL